MNTFGFFFFYIFCSLSMCIISRIALVPQGRGLDVKKTPSLLHYPCEIKFIHLFIHSSRDNPVRFINYYSLPLSPHGIEETTGISLHTGIRRPVNHGSGQRRSEVRGPVGLSWWEGAVLSLFVNSLISSVLSTSQIKGIGFLSTTTVIKFAVPRFVSSTQSPIV